MSPVAPCFACSPPTLSTQHPRSPLFADYHQDGQNAPFYILLEPPMAVVVGCTGASSPRVCRCSSADEDAQLIVRRASHWRAAASTARVPLRPRSSSSSLRHPSPPSAPPPSKSATAVAGHADPTAREEESIYEVPICASRSTPSISRRRAERRLSSRRGPRRGSWSAGLVSQRRLAHGELSRACAV